MFLLSWLQIHGSMENGEKRLSTQESKLLTPELDPAPKLETKAMSFTPPACVEQECQLSVTAELQQNRSGVLHTWDCEEYKADGLQRQTLVSEVPPSTREKVSAAAWL